MRAHPLLLSILAVLPGCSETFVTDGCVFVEEDAKTCPAPKDVSLDDLHFPDECRSEVEIVEIKGGGELRDGAGKGRIGPACCYPVEVIDNEPNSDCIPGRPYFDQGQAQLAPVTVRTSMATATAQAQAWALAGAAEHASVAAFNRLSLQLLALGAPVELLGAVQQAALDEVYHAQACFKLATEMGGEEVVVGAFPFAGPIDPHVNLAELAYAAVREGCLAETLGAAVLASATELVADERLQSVLKRLSQEEAEHAVLSFRIVAWAVQTGGQEVRDAVVKALNEPWPRLDVSELALRTGVERSVIEHATLQAYNRVLRPAATALRSSC
jgi:hypothetical protein